MKREKESIQRVHCKSHTYENYWISTLSQNGIDNYIITQVGVIELICSISPCLRDKLVCRKDSVRMHSLCVLTIALLQLTMTAILQPAPEPDLNDFRRIIATFCLVLVILGL